MYNDSDLQSHERVGVFQWIKTKKVVSGKYYNFKIENLFQLIFSNSMYIIMSAGHWSIACRG